MTVSVPIVAGALRGRRWLPASGGKVLRVLLGSYEPEQTTLFQRCLSPGDVAFDVGAHVGYYTLLAATRVGMAATVFAFEPNPRNLRHLRHHVEINGLENVEIVPVAVADAVGVARFEQGSGSGTGHLGDAGALEVPTLTLDAFVAQRGVVPQVIKIDVEGAELRVLHGARQLLQDHHPVLFLSTHGPGVHAACTALLRESGYRVEAVLGTDPAAAAELLCIPSS